jgi:hypothetical protein
VSRSPCLGIKHDTVVTANKPCYAGSSQSLFAASAAALHSAVHSRMEDNTKTST